ncbi:hypothetical protein LTS07_011477 [Exophiala sideris]|uniref:Retrotransposon gag domain-containing protein n=1 Tax=Exophiala sideris TaxID=1016849 RepID=A0ABR0IU16_9EURO|nr:hypothetical protein LTS07_011477 [Exophiala sideris]KAK5047843.1 hypothetical protein LTR69_011482 [Exophiala sideris]
MANRPTNPLTARFDLSPSKKPMKPPHVNPFSLKDGIQRSQTIGRSQSEPPQDESLAQSIEEHPSAGNTPAGQRLQPLTQALPTPGFFPQSSLYDESAQDLSAYRPEDTPPRGRRRNSDMGPSTRGDMEDGEIGGDSLFDDDENDNAFLDADITTSLTHPHEAKVRKQGFSLKFCLEWIKTGDAVVTNPSDKVSRNIVDPYDELDFDDAQQFLAFTQKQPNEAFQLIRRLVGKYVQQGRNYSDQRDKMHLMRQELRALKKADRDAGDLETSIVALNGRIADLMNEVNTLTSQEREHRRSIQFYQVREHEFREITLGWKAKVQKKNDIIQALEEELRVAKAGSNNTSQPALSTRIQGAAYPDDEEARDPARDPVRDPARGVSLPEVLDRGRRSPTRHTLRSEGGTIYRMKVPDPEKFTGEKEKYEAWKSEMVYKIHAEKEHFDRTGEKAVVMYMASRLKDFAHEVIEPELPTHSPAHLAIQTEREMWKSLDQHFMDHDKQQTAQVEYEQLKQESGESFDDFLSRFKKFAIRLEMTEKTRMLDLMRKLNDRLRRRVNDGYKCNSLADLINKCRDQERALRNAALWKSEQGQGDTRSSTKTTKKTTSSSLTTTTKDDKKHKVPMPESLAKLPKLTPQLKSQLRKDNKCYGCRQVGCRPDNADCTYAKWKQANASAHVLKLDSAYLGHDIPTDDDTDSAEEDARDDTDGESVSGN